MLRHKSRAENLPRGGLRPFFLSPLSRGRLDSCPPIRVMITRLFVCAWFDGVPPRCGGVYLEGFMSTPVFLFWLRLPVEL